MSVKTVVLVGSNPSRTSPSDSAFDPAVKSAKTLSMWLSGIEARFVFINVSDIKTENNKPLSTSQIKESLPTLRDKLDAHPEARVVALGKTAEKALTMLGRNDFLPLPHPSGMNRKLNDPETVRLTKQNLKDFSQGYNIITDAT